MITNLDLPFKEFYFTYHVRGSLLFTSSEVSFVQKGAGPWVFIFTAISDEVGANRSQTFTFGVLKLASARFVP